ncbi:YwqJ-related putative deaminase, partial [uncultured Microbulbifer sp.]|uniref:YwqJ-related putative deaminase n=1 Tax=uncultured Microbulbifer sp. TaxID=348147 RepID=UPI0026124FDF
YATTQYDENGLATDEVIRSRNTFLGDGQTVDTTITNAYPEDGGAATVTTLHNTYEKWDSYKTKSVVISADNKDLHPKQRDSWENGEAFYTYDSNGHIRRVYDVEGERAIAYVTDKDGRTLVREEVNDDGENFLGREMRHFYYFNGHAVGDVGNDQVPSRYDYVKALAQTNNSGNRHSGSNGDHVQAVQSADFDQNYQPINPNYPTASYSSFEAQGGETLQSIAAMVWGDSSLWYLLADANGMKGDEVLTKGQRLELPNVVTNIHNNSDTFRPVDGALQMGDTAPTLPDVPPPPPVDTDDGCGLKQIIVLVVAVVAAFYLGPLVFNAIGGVAGAFAAGATVNAVTQVASIAVGLQDSFDWGAVAKSGVTSAVTFGVMEGLQTVSESGSWLNSTAKFLSTNKIGAAATQNVVNQGVNMAFGDQETFNWAAVAVAGAGGAIQGAMDGSFEYNMDYQDYQTRTYGKKSLNSVDDFLTQAKDIGELSKTLLSVTINEALESAVWDRKFDFAAVAQSTASSHLGYALSSPVQREMPVTNSQAEKLARIEPEKPKVRAVEVAATEQQTATEQVVEARKQPAASHTAKADAEVKLTPVSFDTDYSDLDSYFAMMDDVTYTEALINLHHDTDGNYLSMFDTGEAFAGIQMKIEYTEPQESSSGLWGLLKDTARELASEINYQANVLFGAAEIFASGLYNGGVSIVGGVASVPAVFNSVDMAVDIQESIYDTWSWELKSFGAHEITAALAPAAQTVGGWIDDGRGWSEEQFGLGATAFTFGAVEAGLEIGALLTGTKGVKGAWGEVSRRVDFSRFPLSGHMNREIVELQFPYRFESATLTMGMDPTRFRNPLILDVPNNSSHSYNIIELRGLSEQRHLDIINPDSPHYLPNSQRGPVLSVLKDNKTGDVFYGRNTGLPPMDEIHPILRKRLINYEKATGGNYPPNLQNPGDHSEFLALNEALNARVAANVPIDDLADFGVYNVRIKGTKQGLSIHRCPNCSFLTEGITSYSDWLNFVPIPRKP